MTQGAITVRPRKSQQPIPAQTPEARTNAPTKVTGRVWRIDVDNIDTDMIFHNRHLSITAREEMGQHAFGNLEGYERFAKEAKPGDVVVTGKNFGAGSSRQQAVDCFLALGTSVIIAESFGAIYERNAINAGMPILCSPVLEAVQDGDEISVDFKTGVAEIANRGITVQGQPFSDVQLRIFERGGLLVEN